MNKRLKLVWLLVLNTIFMTGMWITDLGSSALGMEQAGVPMMAQSLLITYTPNAIYHAGLLTACLSFIILAIWMIFEVIK
jgi:hypothetical protein